ERAGPGLLRLRDPPPPREDRIRGSRRASLRDRRHRREEAQVAVVDDRLVAVFPLPDVVFFPRTILPLHVFEKRYRAMAKDALEADHSLAVALLQPGWQAHYEKSPSFHEVATIGRIDALEMTRDGRYHFRL